METNATYSLVTRINLGGLEVRYMKFFSVYESEKFLTLHTRTQLYIFTCKVLQIINYSLEMKEFHIL